MSSILLISVSTQKVVCGDEAQVGGNDRAGLKCDDVARDDFGRRDLNLGAVSRDQALGLKHFTNCRPLGQHF